MNLTMAAVRVALAGVLVVSSISAAEKNIGRSESGEGTAPPGPTISLVPVFATGPHSINGQSVSMEPGQRVVFEARLAGWDPGGTGSTTLRAYQVQLDSLGFSSGSQGTVAPVSQACTDNVDCLDLFGGHCSLSQDPCVDDSDCPLAPIETCDSLSTCGYGAFGYDQCTPGFFDRTRDDYVFFGLADLPAFDFSTPDVRAASVVISDNSVPDPGFAVYAVSLGMEASPDAEGTFTIEFKATPETLLVNQSNERIPNLVLIPATVTVATDGLLRAPKNRFLTIVAGEPGTSQAIRVTFDDLPDPFHIHNGLSMWVAEPFDISENGHNVGPDIPGYANFKVSTLTCQPFFMDWSTVGGVIEVHGENVIPSATYRIDVVDEVDPATVVSSTTIVTSRWGDLVGAFDVDGGFWSAPDGTVNITSDILAMLETFSSTPGYPKKVRGDVAPEIPNGGVNILDIVFVLDAFRGLPYPFQPGAAPCG